MSSRHRNTIWSSYGATHSGCAVLELHLLFLRLLLRLMLGALVLRAGILHQFPFLQKHIFLVA